MNFNELDERPCDVHAENPNPQMTYMSHIPEAGHVFVVSSNSSNVSVLRKGDSAWDVLIVPREAAAKLPLGQEGTQLFAVGCDLDVSNDMTVIANAAGGDRVELPASPVLFILDSSGWVSLFAFVNPKHNKADISHTGMTDAKEFLKDGSYTFMRPCKKAIPKPVTLPSPGRSQGSARNWAAPHPPSVTSGSSGFGATQGARPAPAASPTPASPQAGPSMSTRGPGFPVPKFGTKPMVGFGGLGFANLAAGRTSASAANSGFAGVAKTGGFASLSSGGSVGSTAPAPPSGGFGASKPKP